MFGTSLHTTYCKQTIALETAEIKQQFFDHCELLRRMNYCTNYCNSKQLLQRHPLRNPPLLRTHEHHRWAGTLRCEMGGLVLAKTKIRDARSTATTIIFQKGLSSDMRKQIGKWWRIRWKIFVFFSVFHCVKGAFDVASRDNLELKNGASRDELQNGRGRVWAVPKLGRFWMTTPDHRSPLPGLWPVLRGPLCLGRFSARGPVISIPSASKNTLQDGQFLGRHVCRTKLPPKMFKFEMKNGTNSTKYDPKKDPKPSPNSKPLSCYSKYPTLL